MMWYLCSGKTWAKPSASRWTCHRRDSFSSSHRPGCGVEDVGAQATLVAFPSRCQRVAGHHLDGDAHRCGGGDGRGRVVTRGSNRGSDHELPVAVTVTAGHAQDRKPRAGEIVDALSGGV